MGLARLYSIECGHERQRSDPRCPHTGDLLPCAWPGCHKGPPRWVEVLVLKRRVGLEAAPPGIGGPPALLFEDWRLVRVHQTAPTEAWRWVERLGR